MFLPGEPQEKRSLVGATVHGVAESDTTFTSLHFFRLYFSNTLTPKSPWCNSLAWLTQTSLGMQKSWIGFQRCYFSMRQLGICPPQLLASLPITTLFLPRGTRLFFFFHHSAAAYFISWASLCVPNWQQRSRLLVPTPGITLTILYLRGLGLGVLRPHRVMFQGLGLGDAITSLILLLGVRLKHSPRL